MKFEIGDRVKTKYGIGEISDIGCYNFFLVKISGFKGGCFNDIMTSIEYEDRYFWFFEDELKIIQEGNIIDSEVMRALMRNLGVEIGEEFNIKDTPYNPYHFEEAGFLIDRDRDTCSSDVIGDLVLGRKSIEKIPVKEMTIAEIEKALGYRVKVVKG